MGVKIDKRLRKRLIDAAQSVERTPHWLMKHAIVNWLEKIEAGADLDSLTGIEKNELGETIAKVRHVSVRHFLADQGVYP
jgi:RHH-type proline utilization regulon transcriptional repressor/proline dehydrogenase/delta 1-pyrroline-5-carboxylate dehydrogenase